MDRAHVMWNGTSLSDLSQIFGDELYGRLNLRLVIEFLRNLTKNPESRAQPARNLFGGPTASKLNY